jgi:hypothetical protein
MQENDKQKRRTFPSRLRYNKHKKETEMFDPTERLSHGRSREGGAMERRWNDTRGRLSEAALEWIRSKVEDLEFGDVTIIVRQGKIVQIDREEKQRHHEVIRE